MNYRSINRAFPHLAKTICTLLGCSVIAGQALAAPASQTVVYQSGGKAYEGYWQPADHSASQAALVLLVHDWDGLTDYERQRAQMLSAAGYNVFAVDLFGQGIRPERIEDRRQHTGELYKDRARLRRLMEAGLTAALAQVAQQGGDPLNRVVMGYCFGGAAVLEAARSGMAAQGFVTFHGGLQTPEGQSYSATRAPLLILHGSADSAIPMSQFAQLATELEEAGVSHEMITYSGAPHAFTVFGGANYRAEADQKSWARFMAFLSAVQRQPVSD